MTARVSRILVVAAGFALSVPPLSPTAVAQAPRAGAPPSADWPQWLGPSRTGVAAATGIVPKGAVSLRVAWRRPLGVGTAGLAVAGDTLVTLDSDAPRVSAVALSARDGAVLWRAPLDEGLPDEERGPASTPAVADGLAYVLSPACQLRALELATGKTTWHVDLKARFAAAPRQGCASSPLLEGDLVVVQPGAAEDHRVVAFHRRTGELAWSAKGIARASYSSPGVRASGSERQVLVHHTDVTKPDAPRGGVTALGARDGKLLWHTTLDRYWSWSTPVPFGDDSVLLVTWNDATAWRVPRDSGPPAAPLWTSGAFSYYVGLPVYHEGHLYGHGGDFLRCVRVRDGATVWEEKTYPGSVALVDGHLAVLSVTAGLVRLVEATPAGYRERARLLALARGARAEAAPSVVGRRVFARNDEEVVALEIFGTEPG
jgi:outer membrane protein assembly factor BamB